MNVTLSVDDQLVARARKKAEALGKSLNQLIRDYLEQLAGSDDPDRWIAEFERLLEEVSRDDRGQVVARTYLTSETGKVYTMLAHAAGRLD